MYCVNCGANGKHVQADSKIRCCKRPDVFIPPASEIQCMRELLMLSRTISEALVFTIRANCLTEASHLRWALDQTVRKLCVTEGRYSDFIRQVCTDPETHKVDLSLWNCGETPPPGTLP